MGALRRIILAMVLALTAALVPASAQAPGKRVALIIANSAYQGEAPLTNPARDAEIVRAALARAGFDAKVEANLTQQGMAAALRAFRARVEGAEVALVYFAGHGIRVGQTNWMLPVDFRADEVKQDEDFSLFAVAHTQLTQALAGAKVKVAVFDACRNNPFEARLQLAARSVGRTSVASSGLASVEIGDVLVLFSAAPGQIASDGQPGQGTPFAQAFATRLVEPGAEIGIVARRVRADVIRATGGGRTAQAPYVGGSPGPEEVVLVAASRPVVAAPTPAPGPVRDPEVEAFVAANSCDAMRAFKGAYPRSRFAAQADAFLASPRCAPATPAPQPAVTRPDTPSPSSPPASVSFVDARTTPASTRAPLVSNPASLPDFALFRECEGCPEMVVIPAGSFTMGSPASEPGRSSGEGPQVSVRVPRFAISRFETTWDEWAACASAGACQQREDSGFGRGRRPVINVDWQTDTRAFIRFVNSRASGYRLPSEAEWEYAARAGTASAYFWGGDANAGCGFMNGADATAKRSNPSWTTVTCDDGALNTTSVGSYRPNPYGLFDATGNVWEWVEDCYRGNLSGQTAAASTTGDCSLRVLRGGSWYSSPQYLRSALRDGSIPPDRSVRIGFRLARTL